jgi:two-component system sensor histidine kinase BaeS
MGDVAIMGDEGRINQLLNNLLENSLRYTDAGGVIRITCLKGTNRAKIVIEDSEPGVPEELLDHLFDRFFRARPRRKGRGRGSGLGLAICRNIIEAHRGEVTATASKLGGLRVIVTLPLAGK